MPEIEIIRGEWIKTNTSTFPSRRYKYCHDHVKIDGRKIEGHIQVKVQKFKTGERVDTHTGFKDSCVLGYNVGWLARMNGIQI